MEDIQDLYTNYLLSSFGQVTSTGLSSVLDGSVSHDRITRHLSGGASGGKELWLSVKPFAKRHCSDDACVIFDDTIIEKPFSKADENNCYHYDHSKGRNIKGINLLNCLYHSESEQGHVRVPIKLSLGVQVPALLRDRHQKGKAQKRGHQERTFQGYGGADRPEPTALQVHPCRQLVLLQRQHEVHPQEGQTLHLRDQVQSACLPRRHAMDNGQWKGISETVAGEAPVEVYLKGLDIKVLLVRQVFTNKDGSTGERYLVSNDLGLDGARFMAVYKKRRSVEEYHKGIKQNASAGRSPANSLKARANHIFHSILAYVKLEKLRLAHGTNHFAMKAKVYLAAVKAAYRELNRIKGIEVVYEPA